MMKITAFIAHISFLLFVATSCVHHKMGTQTPYDSFAYVEGDASTVVITICDPLNRDSCTIIEDTDGVHFRGSGVVVANSVVHDGRQYVMTAGHICNAAEDIANSIVGVMIDDDKIVTDVDIDIRFKVSDNKGGERVGRVAALDVRHDLCILAIDDSHLPAVTLAKHYPHPGSKIYNIAAPLGVWEPGTTHRFDGYYAGPYHCKENDKIAFSCREGEHIWSYYSLPAAPGSSGSPIFNDNDQLIGIVVMVTRNFSHIVIAVRLEDMRALLDDVVKFELTPEGQRW